jgi:hypothetical protein
MTHTVRNDAIWRLLILAAGVGLLLAGCGAAEPGKDALGNSAAKSTGSGGVPSGYHRDCELGQALDKCPLVKDGPAITTTAITEEVETVDPEAPAPAGVVQLKVGEAATVTQNSGEATGTIQVLTVTTRKKTNSEYGEKPKFGRYVEIQLAAQSTTGVFDINPFDFFLVSPDGTRYGYSEGNASSEDVSNALHDASLNPGEKLRGRLVFDAAPAAGQLAYAPGMSQTLATWALGK